MLSALITTGPAVPDAAVVALQDVQAVPSMSETVMFDTRRRGSRTMSVASLEVGVTYWMTIDGTWNFQGGENATPLPTSWYRCGASEPMPETPSPGANNGAVQQDAEFWFAWAGNEPCEAARHIHGPLLLRTGQNGLFRHIEPVGGQPTSVAPDHRYIYQVVGEGFPIEFTLDQYYTDANYGQFTITLSTSPPRPAGYGQTASESAGGGNPAMSNTHVSSADPVDTATGELHSTERDLELGGRVPVGLSRTYSSLRTDKTGLFGYAWSSPADMRIAAGNPTRVVNENGSTSYFVANPDGTFTAPVDVFASLSRDASTGVYTYVRRGADTYTFDSSGRLTSMRNRNGETVTLSWTSAAVVVTTPDGRVVTLSRDAAGRVVQADGPGGRIVGYRYDAAGNLDRVTDPRGKISTYGYDGQHRLITKISAAGNVTSTTYGADGRVATQVTPRGGTWTLNYTPSGDRMVTRVTDPTGSITDYTYDFGLLTETTTDPAGTASTWSNTYDDAGNQITATDPTGVVTRATYDTRGNALSTTDGAGNVTTVTYNNFNQPLTVTDAAGHSSSWTYDSSGNLLTASVPLTTTTTATTTLVRDPAHRDDVTSTTDADGRRTTSTYTAAGFLASSVTGSARSTWTYNGYGQPLTEVSPRGNATPADPAQFTTGFSYDAAGNLASVTDPLGHTATFGYDDDNRPVTATDAAAKTTTTAYLPDGNISSVTDPLGRATTFTYDLAGRPLSNTAPDGGITTSRYDASGRPVTVTKPSGNTAGIADAAKAARTVTTNYDKAGRTTTVSTPDPNGSAGASLVTTTGYDTAGRVATVTNPAGERLTYSYDILGRINAVTNPLGKVTQLGYDWAGQQVSVTDPLSRTATTRYTAAGLVAATANAAGDTTEVGYDAAGRVTTVVDPRGTCTGCPAASFTTTYGYDPDGNPTRVTDQLGRVTTTAYDAAGRPVTVTDALGRQRVYGYDVADRLTTVTAPDAGITTYGYDAGGQLISTQNPGGKTSTFTYDAAGRPASATNPLTHKASRTWTVDGQVATEVTARGNAGTPAAGTVSHSYDPLGRLTSTGFGDGATATTYRYDKASRVTAMTDAGGTQTRGYDPAGRLTSVARGASSWAYGYHDDGTVATRRRPDASVETWTYDAAARATQVVSPAGTLTFGYDKASNLVRTTHPNNTVQTQTWDRAGQLSSTATTKGTATLVSHTLTRDAVDNPTQMVLARGTATETRSYRYDANDRLQGVCYVALTSCTGASQASQWWTYDLNGNRATEKNGTGTGTTTTYTYDNADRLTTRKTGTAAAVALTHDPDGNLLADGTTTWTYDLNNRTTSSQQGTTTTGWLRDGEGNLLSQSVGATVTDYGWDLNNTIPRLATATTGGTTSSYRYDPAGRPAQLTRGTVTQTIAHDPLGSVTDLIASTGTIVRNYDYTPFGNTRTAIGGPTTGSGPHSNLRYAGMLTSAAGTAGTTYTSANRTYQPDLGRWTGVDPITPPMQQPFDTAYSYVGNQPTRYIDPLGQSACDVLPVLCSEPTQYVKNEAIGVGQGAASFVDQAVHPVRTYHQAVAACNAGFDAMSGGTGATWKGAAQCIDNLNPVANVRREFATAISTPCLDDSAQAFGRGLFGAFTIAAPGAKGVGLRSTAAEDGARLASRTDQLTGALDPIAQNSRTSAVMSTRQGADVLAGGGRDLSPAQRALGQGDDVLGRLPGAHAEITAMDAAGKAGLTPWQMAVSRPICPACQSAIEGSGGTVAPGGMFAWWPW